jgi:hypothetical protein
MFGYKKIGDKGLDDKDRYILNWSAKNEKGEGLWKILKQ